MALGNAIHAGLAEHYGPANDPFGVAYETLEREFVDGSEWTLEGCRKLVERGLAKGLETELLSPEGRVVGVERWVSHTKVDLISREPFGLVITDHKVKLELEKRKLEYTVRDYDPSWQLLQSAWAARNLFGETPKWARAHLIVLGPRPFTHVHSIPIDDARLDDFERSSIEHWATMEVQARPGLLPPMNTRSCWRYGRKCEFYDGCHVLSGDVTKFPSLYERKEAR